MSLEKEFHTSPARDADILDLSLSSSMNRDIKVIGPMFKITGRRKRDNHGFMSVRNRKPREKEHEKYGKQSEFHGHMRDQLRRYKKQS
jgi:hypothetical protein